MISIRIRRLLTILSFVPALSQAQTSTENYVMTKTMLNASGDKTMKSVQYYNGLGYPTVSVATSGSSGETAYSLTTYDALGREERRYVPVAMGQSLLYKSPNTIANSVRSAYGDNTAYSTTLYDALDRPVSVTTPGAAFAAKPSVTEYSANSASEVIRYGVGSDNNLTQNGYYPAGSLTKEVGRDADGKSVDTFKDIYGHVVMQRVGGSLCTYYVYDELSRLRFVLTPEYQNQGSTADLAYEYRYDNRGRVNYKKLPGAEYMEYWYDDADRMTCMRDGMMRNAGKYRFFVYDMFDRLVLQGLCTSCRRSSTVYHASFSTSASGILGTGYAISSDYTSALKNAELETASYYDNYDFLTKNPCGCFTGMTLPSSSVSQTGQLTGRIVAATNGELLSQAMQYDIRGNVTACMSKDVGGRMVSNTSSYTFTNKVARSTSTVDVSYGNSLTAVENMSYNKRNDKLENSTLTVNHGTASSSDIGYGYDALGRLTLKNRPLPVNAGMVTGMISYSYDMRGWLKSIGTNSFWEQLFYADNMGRRYYNGNISSIKWRDNSSSTIRGYTFTYDGANRLTDGHYAEGDALTSNMGRYSESVWYDDNGNVTGVTRYGKTSSGYGRMDDLTIWYTGNQPDDVYEYVADNNASGSFEYKKSKGSAYKFNANGSLVADKSRGIAYITYDLGNNPQQIYFTNGSVTKYIYSASGQKLRVVHYTAKPNISRTWGVKPVELTASQILQADSTDYMLGGSLTLKNGKIDRYLFDGGYAQATVASATTDNFAFYYYNQDHLGNIREVVDASGNILQVTNYYPFGTPYFDASSTKNADMQPYKYNGKELDRMHGLDTYDYGARQYDPILARWDRIDPLCEKYYGVSPYVYCRNSPVKHVDPDGREIWIYYVDENGITQSFQYSAGMTCPVDNSIAQTMVSNLNVMYSNQDGATVLDAIIGKQTKYGIRQTNTHSEDGEGYFDPSTNIVSMNDANNTMTFAEELFHMYQRVNGQGGATDVNEVEAKLFSSKMNYEINSWNNGSYIKNFAGQPESSYTEKMNLLFWSGYNEIDYESAVNNFFSGSYSGRKYKDLPGYHHGNIKRNPLIKNFLTVK